MIKFRNVSEVKLWDKIVMIQLRSEKLVSTATSEADRVIEARRERESVMPSFVEFTQAGIPR